MEKLKIYTVASNARRDARKAGLPTDLDEVDGGWVIRALKARIPDGVDRVDHLGNLLATGWQMGLDLEDIFGMDAARLRAVLAMLVRTRGWCVERKTERGFLMYRKTTVDKMRGAEAAA